MPATAFELFEGRTQKLALTKDEKSTREVPWVAVGAADETEAVQAVFDTAEVVTTDGLTRTSIDLTGRPNATTWLLKVSYEGPSKEDEEKKDEEEQGGIFSFDTGGGTQHITQSITTVSASPPGAPKFNQAIGWDGQRVQGVDITVPVFNFTLEVTLPVEQVTQKYIRRLFDLTGKVNEDVVLLRIQGTVVDGSPEWQPGELLFLGATGSREQKTDLNAPRDWKITYRFAASPNEKNKKVGGINQITIPKKDGWDYVWIAYEPDTDKNSKSVIRQAVAAYVEQVYERAKFKDLGTA